MLPSPTTERQHEQQRRSCGPLVDELRGPPRSGISRARGNMYPAQMPGAVDRTGILKPLTDVSVTVAPEQ